MERKRELNLQTNEVLLLRNKETGLHPLLRMTERERERIFTVWSD